MQYENILNEIIEENTKKEQQRKLEIENNKIKTREKLKNEIAEYCKQQIKEKS